MTSFEPLGWLDRQTRTSHVSHALKEKGAQKLLDITEGDNAAAGVWTYRRINWTTSTSKITFPSTIRSRQMVV